MPRKAKKDWKLEIGDNVICVVNQYGNYIFRVPLTPVWPRAVGDFLSSVNYEGGIEMEIGKHPRLSLFQSRTEADRRNRIQGLKGELAKEGVLSPSGNKMSEGDYHGPFQTFKSY